MVKILKTIENLFETFLFKARYIVIIAVIGSLIAAVIMFVKSTLQVITALLQFAGQLKDFGPFSGKLSRQLVSFFVSSVDDYLFGTVLIIFSMGLYELFISKINVSDSIENAEEKRPSWLKVNSIDDLKNSLGKVILMILIVSFFEYSLNIEYRNSLDLLELGVGVLFISIALYLVHKKQGE